MNKSLKIQVTCLLVLSVLLAVANNFRPSAAIEWVRDWQDYSEVLAKGQNPDEAAEGIDPADETSAADEEDPADAMARVTEMISNNFEVTDIGLKTAKLFHRYGRDFTLWIDARSPELYEAGHIAGAVLCHLYEKNTYLPVLEEEIANRQPISLIVYCKGADCTDSHVLAQDLFALGHENIFVYTGGFDVWHQAGLPIEGELSAAVDESGETGAKTAAEKPAGMYLEHVVRDMVPFLLGLFLLITWRRSERRRGMMLTAAIFAGAFFIWAAYPKIANPFLFAKNIWNYDIAPGAIINLSALILPMVELTAGLAMVTGFFRRGGSLIIGLLLIVFILAVGFNVLRGHEFNCGCTSTATMVTDIYLAGWNEKIALLLRDFGLLIMAALAFRKPTAPVLR